MIKFEQDMAQVIHGVNKYNRLALYNLPLSIQILVINLFITFIGLIFLIFFNYILIKNDDEIKTKKIIANQNLKSIQSFLEKNSIIRVPLFNDNCLVENINTCKDDDNLELSDPVLEPKITQEFVRNKYLNSDFNVKIYNEDWIRLVDTLDLYDFSIVEETYLPDEELNKNNLNFLNNLSQKYLILFSSYYDYLIKKDFLDKITKEKAEIFYVSESIKEQVIKEYYIEDKGGNLYLQFTAPIQVNKKVYGVIILSYPITNQVKSLGYTSLNILSFFILFVMIMIFMSLIFSQSLVSPIKKLSKLTILERERVNENKIIYPNRKDEIGVLSDEIQNMSAGLKLQIQQLEKFSEDVSHELKNPLTSLQSAMELIEKDSIAKADKNLLIKNILNDLRRMNQLITDISKFTRVKVEIELEKNQLINLNFFLDQIPNIFKNNTKNIKLVINKCYENIEVLGNKNKLTQVFVNLIENSISFSPKKTKILIELKKIEKNSVSIKIFDQGKGINFKDSEKIFERFYTDRQEDIKNHTGLGLSIAREIVTHMNGKLKLKKSDKSDYSGACFLIILPIRHSS
ncbi:HAMP domain-containing histidine kinase [Pelagibacterales bacterium SAG-MED31]|nr:HAMP domain-containing histidine kinase [Pelagibacterales bacterium SAG-MED31]